MMQLRHLWHIFSGLLVLVIILPPIRLFYFNAGLRWQYLLLLSFLLTYFLTPFCRIVAIKLDIMDRPTWRKIHSLATPLMGGIAVATAFIIALLINNIYLPGMQSLIIGSLAIFIMGLWDDIKPISPIIRFIIQIIVTLFVMFVGDIRLTLFPPAPWSEILNIPLTILWMVGLTNAMNFFDGIDGLATGLAIFIAAFLGIIAFNTNQPAFGWLAATLAGACLGFMPHNFRIKKPAIIFLGDSGSTFLGFTLAGLAVLGEWSRTSHFVSSTAPILIFGVLIFDMVYVTASRLKNRTTSGFFDLLASPNTDHLHHRLLFMGFERKEAVFTIYTMSVCLGVSALIIMDQRIIEALLGILQAILVLGLIVVLMLKGRDCPTNSNNSQLACTIDDQKDDI